MKSSRRLLVMVLCMMVTLNIPINAFTDLDPDSDTTKYIEEFQERGLTNGYPDGTFKPQNTITRAEFVTLINRTFQYEAVETSINYTDVKDTDWFVKDLKIAADKGYIKGYPDGTFRPYKNISRQEVAVVLNRILKLSNDVYTELDEEVPSWCRDAVQAMIGHGIMFVKDKKFQADVDITREDSVVSLLTVIHQEEAAQEDDTEVDGDGTLVDTDQPVSGGADLDEPIVDEPDADVIYAMEVTIRGLEEVLNQETKYAQKLESNHLDLVRAIKTNMENYLADYTYDYESNARIVNAEYKLLPENEQSNIENAINASVPYMYLNRLEEYFKKD